MDETIEAVGDESTAEAFWEGRYRAGQTWSGEPNALLVEEVRDLAPGSVLDLGSGEGGDAIWLAEQGWQVTAVDVSSAALALAAEAAAAAGVGDSIRWEQHDLSASMPTGRFDLVASCYLHAPPEVPLARSEILRAAADLVLPGGSLVVVGHSGPPSWAAQDDPHHGVHLPAPEEVFEQLALPTEEWELVASRTVAVPMTSPDGVPGTRPDNVVHLRRSS